MKKLQEMWETKNDKDEEDGETPSCKYSSGKMSNGLEKCSGCGVGYRYSLIICLSNK